jgi:large subunit ribosomal protein L25
MTPIFNLKANTRNNLGSGNSRRFRKAGQIPAVICNKKSKNLNIVIDTKEFERQYFKGNILTTITHIDLDGKTLKVIPHKIELNPVTDKPEHVDFVTFDDGQTIKTKPKLNFINKDKSIGLKRGGFLHVALREIEVLCSSDLVVNSIDVDVITLKVGDKIRSKDLQLPDGFKFVQKDGFLVASIIGRGTKDEDESAKTEGTSAANAAADTKTASSDKKDAPKKSSDKK